MWLVNSIVLNLWWFLCFSLSDFRLWTLTRSWQPHDWICCHSLVARSRDHLQLDALQWKRCPPTFSLVSEVWNLHNKGLDCFSHTWRFFIFPGYKNLFLKFWFFCCTVDIWSAGCIMAEMITGRILFEGKNRILLTGKLGFIVIFMNKNMCSFFKKLLCCMV